MQKRRIRLIIKVCPKKSNKNTKNQWKRIIFYKMQKFIHIKFLSEKTLFRNKIKK